MCKLSLNQNLTTRVPLYNSADDYWYVNGVKYKKAYLQDYVVFTSDSWENGHSKGNSIQLYSQITNDGGFTYTIGKGLFAKMPNVSHGKGNMIVGSIDFSKYTELVVEVTSNGTSYIETRDVSGYSQTAYIGIGMYSPNSNDRRLNVYIESAQSPTYLDGANQIAQLGILYAAKTAYSQEVCITALYLK